MINIEPEHEYGAPSDIEEELIVTYDCDCQIIDKVNVPICCPTHKKPIVCVARYVYFEWGDEGYFESD